MKSTVCRICFYKIEEGVSHCINDYQEKLQYVANVLLADGQPDSICNGCVNELEVSYNFKQKCEQADKLLAEEKIKIEAVIDFDETEVDTHFFDDGIDQPVEKELQGEEAEVITPPILDEEKPAVNEENKAKRQKKEKNVECEECHKRYSHFNSLNVHYRRDHGNKKSYSCERCFRKFYIKKQLEEHEPQCNKLAADPYKSISKKPDNRIVDGENYSFCCHCGKTMGARYLAKHILDIHTVKKEEAPDLTCDLCGEKYKTKNGILDHMKRRHLHSQYKCNFCQEIFSSYGIRRNHEIHFHTFKYRYECEICNHKFINYRDHRKHMVTHSGEKNYLCTLCGMRVSRKSVLDLHMATHSDVRPFSCKICSAAFKTKKALRVHHNVHEERKYECPVCQQRFLVNQAMRLHVSKRHPEFELPPPGTIMNKKALKRIEEISSKYNIKVNTKPFSFPPGTMENRNNDETINAKSIINTNFEKTILRSRRQNLNEKDIICETSCDTEN